MEEYQEFRKCYLHHESNALAESGVWCLRLSTLY